MSKPTRGRPSLRASWALGLGLAALLASPPASHANDGRVDGKGWVFVREVPEVAETFTKTTAEGTLDPTCDEIGRNPQPERVDCWASYVTRTADQRHAAQMGSGLQTVGYLCVEGEWEFLTESIRDWTSFRKACPFDDEDGRCVRPKLARRQILASEARPLLGAGIKRMTRITAELAHDFTGFEYLRRGQGHNPFDTRLSALTLKHGLTVLFQAYRILRVREELDAGQCAHQHLDSFFTFADERASLVFATLDRVLEVYPDANAPWERRLFDLQAAVLRGRANLEQSTPWRQTCEQALAASDDLDDWDADIAVWCGYAYRRVGDSTRSRQALNRAMASPNNPAASSYANGALDRSPEPD